MTEIEHSFMWLKNTLTLERRVQDGGTPVHPWLIHVDIRQKQSEYCKVVILQLKEIN